MKNDFTLYKGGSDMKRGSCNRDQIKIGEVAAAANVAVSTVRHYTKLGLVRVSAYTAGGQYLYDADETLDMMRFIDDLRRRGMKLGQIKEQFCDQTTAKKVVIIDDEKAIVDSLKTILGTTYPAWDIRTATNVFEAGHLLIDFLPDLVIVDINLPGVNGNEITKFIKNTIALRHTKVISITGGVSKDSELNAVKSGTDGFLAKPFDIQTFISKIGEVLCL
jgi:PleD family two-component response regulator